MEFIYGKVCTLFEICLRPWYIQVNIEYFTDRDLGFFPDNESLDIFILCSLQSVFKLLYIYTNVAFSCTMYFVN